MVCMPAGDDWDEEFNGFSVYGVSTQSVETSPCAPPAMRGSWLAIFGTATITILRTVPTAVKSGVCWHWDADLGNNTISGGVDEIWVKTSRDDGEEWEEWSDTISMEFANGRVVDGRVVASWSGEDTSSTTSDAYSLRGFQAICSGSSMGRLREEIAGVINGFRKRPPPHRTKSSQVRLEARCKFLRIYPDNVTRAHGTLSACRGEPVSLPRCLSLQGWIAAAYREAQGRLPLQEDPVSASSCRTRR